MKKHILFIILIFICSSSYSHIKDSTDVNTEEFGRQTIDTVSKTENEIDIYKAKLTLISGYVIEKSVLYQVNDSSIFITRSLKKTDYALEQFAISSYYYNNIKSIQLQKNYSRGIRALTGSLIGFCVGGIIGFASGDDPPGTFFQTSAEEKALTAAIALGGVGAITGLLIGPVKVTIPINGNFNTFKKNKNKLNDYAIKSR